MTATLTAGICLALLTAAAALLLRRHDPEIALLLAVGGCVLLTLSALPALKEAVAYLEQTVPDGAAAECLPVLLRVAGLVLLSRFGAELCRDAGQNALAMKVELLGCALGLTAALPVFSLLGELLREVVP